MFDRLMLPVLLLAIGVAGVVWFSLDRIPTLPKNRVDGLAVVSGLAVGFAVTIFVRHDYMNYSLIIISLIVLLASYYLVQFENRRKNRRFLKAPKNGKICG